MKVKGIVVASAAIGVASLFTTTTARSQSNVPATVPVQVWSFPPSSPEIRGMGFTVASVEGGCRMLSAAHTFRTDSSEIRFTFPRLTQEGSWTIADRGRSIQDFAISPETSLTWFGPPCPKLPRVETVEQILTERRDNGSGVIAMVSASNTPSNVFIRIASWGPQTIVIRGASDADRLLAGMSGAPLIVSGRVVGMFAAVKPDGTGEVLRFEAAPESIRAKLAFDGDMRPEAAVNVKQHDISQMPDSVRVSVAEARRIRTLSEAMAQQAQLEAERAQAQAELANGLDYNQVLSGVGRFVASNGNIYAGQVAQRYGLFTNSTSSRGYGISETRVGDTIGDKRLCQFGENSGCVGAGVYEWAQNRGNINGFSTWRGEFQNNAIEGLGELTFKAGGRIFMFRKHDNRGKIVASEGVWEYPGGSRFEGRIGNRIEFGVLWQANGQWQCIGYWNADGQVDVTRNQAEKMPGCR
jgi:hypothetical protein